MNWPHICVFWIRAKSVYCMNWMWHSFVCVHKSVKLGRWSHNEILYLILFWLCPTRIWHSRQCLLLLYFIKAQWHSDSHIQTQNIRISKKPDHHICLRVVAAVICRVPPDHHRCRHKFSIQNIAQYGNCKVNFSCIIRTLQHSIIISRSSQVLYLYTKSIAGNIAWYRNRDRVRVFANKSSDLYTSKKALK